jgi:hypothetical protein
MAINALFLQVQWEIRVCRDSRVQLDMWESEVHRENLEQKVIREDEGRRAFPSKENEETMVRKFLIK